MPAYPDMTTLDPTGTLRMMEDPEIQLTLEYSPQPPFQSGTPEEASPETLAAASALVGAAFEAPPG